MTTDDTELAKSLYEALAPAEDGPDEIGPDDTAEQHPWRITDDRQATWALRKYAAYLAKVAEVDRLRSVELDKLDQWAEAAKASPARQAQFMFVKLVQYLRDRQAADPKLRRVLLPSGIVKATKSTKLVVDDADVLLEWAEAQGIEDYVKRPPAEARPGEIKKALNPEAVEQVYDADGDPVTAPNGEPLTRRVPVTRDGDLVPGVRVVVADNYTIEASALPGDE